MVSGNKDSGDPKKIPPKDRLKKTNNYLRANFLSRTWFMWMMPTFWRGYKRDLYDSDLTKPKDNHLSDKLGDRLEKRHGDGAESRRAVRGTHRVSIDKAPAATIAERAVFNDFVDDDGRSRRPR